MTTSVTTGTIWMLRLVIESHQPIFHIRFTLKFQAGPKIEENIGNNLENMEGNSSRTLDDTFEILIERPSL